jgi:hypothetical protein
MSTHLIVPNKEVDRIRWHSEVISEGSQGAGRSNRLGEAQAADGTHTLTTRPAVRRLVSTSFGIRPQPNKVTFLCRHSLIEIRQQEHYAVYCTQGNLQFTFPESTISLIIFLLVLPQRPQQQHYISLNPFAYTYGWEPVWVTDVFAFSSSFLSVDGMTCRISF